MSMRQGLVMTLAVAAAACSAKAPEPAAPPAAQAQPAPDRPYLLERVDEAAVVQLYADGFDELAPREKTLIYHLSRAALAGRDIYYDQRYAPSLDMREVIEEVLTHAESVDPDTLARIHHYAKLFWLNSGPHNGQTARKFLIRCEPDAFEAAVRAAAEVELYCRRQGWQFLSR